MRPGESVGAPGESVGASGKSVDGPGYLIYLINLLHGQRQQPRSGVTDTCNWAEGADQVRAPGSEDFIGGENYVYGVCGRGLLVLIAKQSPAFLHVLLQVRAARYPAAMQRPGNRPARRTYRPGPGVVAIILTVASAACSDRKSASIEKPLVRLMHTFQGDEAIALNEAIGAIAGRELLAIEQTPVPFYLAKSALDKELARDQCVDLLRIDATWLPELVAQNKLRPVPDEALNRRDWLPAARALGAIDDVHYGLPQIIDGLALVYRLDIQEALGASWPASDIDQLVATMHKLADESGQKPFGVRNAGYWFVPFLRAWGSDMPDPTTGCVHIDSPTSLRALQQFADLFGSIAPQPTPTGEEAKREARSFRTGDLSVILTGPWAVTDLTGGDTRSIGVAPMPGAPLSGQLYVVPTCAAAPERAWHLASLLTRPELQADWAERLRVIPTTRESMAHADRFVREFFLALEHARPLPTHRVISELFEDLDPALRNLVFGHASAQEIQVVLTEAWSKRMAGYNIEPRTGCTLKN